MKRSDIEAAYRRALKEYIATDGSESARMRALACGHAAVEAGWTLLQMRDMHLAAGGEPDQALTRERTLGREFQTQGLLPFEAAARGYREANAGLRALNASLEERVASRTRELQALNATFEQQVAERTKALAESEERFRLLAENARDAVFRLALVPEPHFEYVNPASETIFGFTPEEFYADYGVFFSHIHADDRALISPAPERPPAEAATFRWIRRDGSIAWIDSRITLSRNERGDVIAFEGIGRDVTGRMESEEAIRRLNAELTERVNEFQTLFDVLPVGVGIAHDPDCRILTPNPAFVRLMGLPEESVNTGRAPIASGQTDFRRAGRHVAAPDQPMHVAARTNSDVSDWVAEIPRPDGSVVSVVAYATPLRDAIGNVRGSIGAYVDISTIKAAEESIRTLNAELSQRAEELRASEELIRLTVDTALDAIITMDENGLITGWNRKAEAIFGWSRTDAIGRSMSDTLIPPQHRAAHRRGLQHFLKTGEGPVMNRRIEITALRRDGREFPVELAITAAQTGDRHSFSAFIRDISEADEERRASLAKSEFLSRMSHELRTPLNAILGFGQLLELDRLQGGQGEAVEHILTAGRHLLQLIDEVLDISGIEAGRLSLSPEPVSLRDVLQTSMDLAGPLASSRAVTMLVTTPEVLATFVLADRQRLQQVLLNLLSNAVKYNRTGGKVSVAIESRSDDLVRLWVRDTGTGIPRGELGRLFSPFERIGSETSGVEGTGLGLAISKRLVEAMHGAIGVETHGRKGSNFWIDLPRADDPVVQSHLGQLQALTEPHQSIVPARTVLYIEDNRSNLTLVERILARLPGYRMLAAMQASMGIELAREHQPDVILLDLHLPDVPGAAVLAQLQADPQTAGIPVIVISADATPGQIGRLLSAGASRYLTKPLHVGQFLDAVVAAAGSAGNS